MWIPDSFVEQLVIGLILVLVGAALVFGWKCVRFFWLRHKIEPHLNEMTKTYREEIGEYFETTPRLVVSDRRHEEKPYGIIFITPEEIDVVEQVFLLNIPPACSLRKVRLLFNPLLKAALFDYFSWRLALRRKREDIASKILDNAMTSYSREFKVIQKLHEEEKLSVIVLQEALRRLRRYKDLTKISPDDVDEYSKIVKEWAERDFQLVLVGDKPPEAYCEAISQGLSGYTEVLALARGSNVKRLRKVDELCTQVIKPLYTRSEEDEWYRVERDDTLPVLRIWFRRSPFENTLRSKPVG